MAIAGPSGISGATCPFLSFGETDPPHNLETQPTVSAMDDLRHRQIGMTFDARKAVAVGGRARFNSARAGSTARASCIAQGRRTVFCAPSRPDSAGSRRPIGLLRVLLQRVAAYCGRREALGATTLNHMSTVKQAIAARLCVRTLSAACTKPRSLVRRDTRRRVQQSARTLTITGLLPTKATRAGLSVQSPAGSPRGIRCHTRRNGTDRRPEQRYDSTISEAQATPLVASGVHQQELLRCAT